MLSNMKIQVIEKTTVQKWMKDDEYNFEVPLEDIYDLIYHIIDNSSANKHDINEMADELMIPYFLDNGILSDDHGVYIPGPNFEEFSDLIYDKLCN